MQATRTSIFNDFNQQKVSSLSKSRRLSTPRRVQPVQVAPTCDWQIICPAAAFLLLYQAASVRCDRSRFREATNSIETGSSTKLAGHPSINDGWPARNRCGRAFCRNYSPRSHINLFAHRRSRRCDGEPVRPCEGTVAGAASATPTILAPQAATPARLRGLATRKPMLLFSFAGLLLFRVDDDKLLELLFQLPPRIPRLDEPSIPIPLLAS